jgi:hypothetical protein
MSPRWMVWIPSSSTTNEVCLPLLVPLGVVAVRCGSGREDVADLVLAWSVEDERLLEATGHHRAAVP